MLSLSELYFRRAVGLAEIIVALGILFHFAGFVRGSYVFFRRGRTLKEMRRIQSFWSVPAISVAISPA
jgi:hypothetical protein